MATNDNAARRRAEEAERARTRAMAIFANHQGFSNYQDQNLGVGGSRQVLQDRVATLGSEKQKARLSAGEENDLLALFEPRTNQRLTDEQRDAIWLLSGYSEPHRTQTEVAELCGISRVTVNAVVKRKEKEMAISKGSSASAS
ncbi:hypothetical protein FRB94_008351 [Tulasnella sp. JGI-2019a]|nr:hypothetical protein FRB94_008351 [Tulasnella sp. JGI-2019a]